MINIVLCGMMGSGKTTVAAALGRLYCLEIIDTDEEIVKEYGDITSIFSTCGEEKFRDIESEVTAKISERSKGAVISLGGGCVLRRANVEKLKDSGKIFYLRTSPETIIKRLKGDNSRPLLKGDLEERVRTISSARAKIYEAAADYIVDTDEKSPEEIAAIIMEHMSE